MLLSSLLVIERVSEVLFVPGFGRGPGCIGKSSRGKKRGRGARLDRYRELIWPISAAFLTRTGKEKKKRQMEDSEERGGLIKERKRELRKRGEKESDCNFSTQINFKPLPNG